jgi:hypothetical protein
VAASTRPRHVARLNGLIATSDGIIVAAPIYNFDVNAAVKNLRCLIVPRSVNATRADFGDHRSDDVHLSSDEVTSRIDALIVEVLRLARA